MGIFNEVMADSVGVLWRGATGTVDPWTKDTIIEGETAALIQAGADPEIAAQQADQDVNHALTTFIDAQGVQGANTEDALSGFRRSVVKLGETIVTIPDKILPSGGKLAGLAIAGAVGLAIYVLMFTPIGKRLTK